jgi:hypothetical protein
VGLPPRDQNRSRTIVDARELAGWQLAFYRPAMAAAEQPGPPPPPTPSRRERFFAGYTWLILKNVIGWLLIVASFVAGPLVPGPGGIPLFLVGFALVNFPGKRRLTARVLRGRPVAFPRRLFLLVSLLVALAVPALALWVARSRSFRLVGREYLNALVPTVLYGVGAALTWLVARSSQWALNLALRLISKGRRRFRPWLRRHRVRLLPPRWRRRQGHEPGVGPLRLRDEILKYSAKRRGRRAEHAAGGAAAPPPSRGD